MSTILTWIEGKKLYITVAIGIIAVLVNHFIASIPGLNLDSANWLTDIWSLVLVATGGAKVNSLIKGQQAAAEELKMQLEKTVK